MNNFTTQEEKLFDEEFPMSVYSLRDRDHSKHGWTGICTDENCPIIELEPLLRLKSFILAHDHRLIDYLLEKWPEEKELQDIYNDEEKELLKKIDMPEKTPEYLRERRYGFNLALTATRKLLEDYKKEI